MLNFGGCLPLLMIPIQFRIFVAFTPTNLTVIIAVFETDFQDLKTQQLRTSVAIKMFISSSRVLYCTTLLLSSFAVVLPLTFYYFVPVLLCTFTALYFHVQLSTPLYYIHG